MIGRHHEIPDAVRAELPAVRANVGTYDRTRAWFTREQLRALYRNCPRWARAERAVYGSTLDEAPVARAS